ncbi:hypothetical protein C5B91_20055 [Haloferax sp. Atlit-10N]|uniref:hypothetical protein n=1 Tax=unclassified Haloferax TaxID=2625095 RepID=UPI000E2692CB|nr:MULTISPECIES: hypothetical protein [unclassified Haloferax]RDZ39393.1 hypothetical protein C5B87_19315 [Haloferax sp. Atlit-16N]RDZ53908.1 hypothetical protein C5B91_20055 [Haloferax sp. Atlit-10N]
MTKTQTRQEDVAEDLSDELLEISTQTVDGRYVRGRVTHIEDQKSNEILLRLVLPNGDMPEFTFEKPIPWKRSFDFVRILEEKGYEPGSIQMLIGDQLLVEPDGEGDWDIVIPSSKWGHIKNAILREEVVAPTAVLSLFFGFIPVSLTIHFPDLMLIASGFSLFTSLLACLVVAAGGGRV